MPQNSADDTSNASSFNVVEQEPLDEDIDIDSYELDYPQVPFGESLDAIQADALAPRDLLGFGNITRKQVHQLRSVWQQLKDEPRAAIAEVTLLVARENPYVDFGKFFQVLLEDELDNVRLNASYGSALSEDSSLIKPLVELAENDRNLDVREAALHAFAPHVVALDLLMIADSNDEDRLLGLKAWASDESWPAVLRAAALQSYSHNTIDEEIGDIIELFVMSDIDELQLGAMRAMAEFGAGKFTRFLELQLLSQDVDAREAAAAAMGMSDDQAVVPMLTMAARTDTEPAVREAAYMALANIGSELAQSSLFALRQNASDDDIEIIDGAIQYIQELQDIDGELEMFEFGIDPDEEN